MAEQRKYMGMSPSAISEVKRGIWRERRERLRKIGKIWVGIATVGAVTFVGAAIAGTHGGPRVGCIVTANPGDTERELARRSDTSILDVGGLNPHKDLGHLAAGDQINLSKCGDLGTDHQVTPKE